MSVMDNEGHDPQGLGNTKYGVATEIVEGVASLRAEIEQLRTERNEARRALWLIVASNIGYVLERHEAENYPGDDLAVLETTTDHNGNIEFRARRATQQHTETKP